MYPVSQVRIFARLGLKFSLLFFPRRDALRMFLCTYTPSPRTWSPTGTTRMDISQIYRNTGKTYPANTISTHTLSSIPKSSQPNGMMWNNTTLSSLKTSIQGRKRLPQQRSWSLRSASWKYPNILTYLDCRRSKEANSIRADGILVLICMGRKSALSGMAHQRKSSGVHKIYLVHFTHFFRLPTGHNLSQWSLKIRALAWQNFAGHQTGFFHRYDPYFPSYIAIYLTAEGEDSQIVQSNQQMDFPTCTSGDEISEISFVLEG